MFPQKNEQHVLKKREPDWKRNPGSSKSLRKEESIYNADKDGERFGGEGGALGAYRKLSKSGDKQAYLSTHAKLEYFIMEILCQIGLNTPKTRFTKHTRSFGGNIRELNALAQNSVEGYIPIAAFFNLEFYGKKEISPKLIEIRNRFTIDFQKQVIIDLQNQKEYKISGNLFAANIGGIFIQDTDFQLEGGNVGLVQRGNRFFAFLIDKDQAHINGKTAEKFSEMPNVKRQLFENRITGGALDEQRLFILNGIDKAIRKDKKGNLPLKNIFLNQRIDNSGILDRNTTPKQREDQVKEQIKNLQKTGESILLYYTDNNLKKLKSFRKREKIREKIADAVIQKLLKISPNIQYEKEALKEIILEDLRAPYYRHFFKNNDNISTLDQENPALVNAIVTDQIEELKALNILTQYDLSQYETKAFRNVVDGLIKYLKDELNRPAVIATIGFKKQLKEILSELENDRNLEKKSNDDIIDTVERIDALISKSGGNRNSVFRWDNKENSEHWARFKEDYTRELAILNQPFIAADGPIKA